MKKILFCIMALVLILNGCSSETTPSNETVTDTESKEVVQSDKLYSGIYYKESSGAGDAYILTSDGASEKIGSVYGYAKITDDGKYVAYNQYKNGSKKMCIKSSSSATATEIADNAEGFYIDPDGEFVLIRCEDGLYYTDNLEEKAKKVTDSLEIQFLNKYFIVSADKKSAYFLDYDENLHRISFDNGFAVTPMSLQGECNDYVVTDEYIFYQINDTAYIIDNNGDVTQIPVNNYWYDANILKTTENDTEITQYISEDGKRINIDSTLIHMIPECSPNGKYFVTVDSNYLYRYDISDEGLLNEVKIDGEFSSFYANDDGTIVASDPVSNVFGIYNGTEYIKLVDEFVLEADTCYDNGKLYYIYNNKLYKYTLNGEIETVAENIAEFDVKDGICYYRLKDNGELYQEGNSKAIDTNVRDISL